MSDTITMSEKFEISIPESIRTEQNWGVGQEFVLIPKGNGVLLVPVPRVEDLRGIARGADTSNYRDRSDRF